MRISRPNRERRQRRGAVAVEFAVVAPILVALLFGLIELGRAFEMQNMLEVAAREGARFASMDRDGLLKPGQSANDKMVDDVKTLLASNGIPKDKITVAIKDHENPNQEFDLDDPANDLKLFEVQVEVNWSDVSLTPVAASNDHPMSATVVFRNGRATIAD
jgi:TadE-like protein